LIVTIVSLHSPTTLTHFFSTTTMYDDLVDDDIQAFCSELSQYLQTCGGEVAARDQLDQLLPDNTQHGLPQQSKEGVEHPWVMSNSNCNNQHHDACLGTPSPSCSTPPGNMLSAPMHVKCEVEMLDQVDSSPVPGLSSSEPDIISRLCAGAHVPHVKKLWQEISRIASLRHDRGGKDPAAGMQGAQNKKENASSQIQAKKITQMDPGTIPTLFWCIKGLADSVRAQESPLDLPSGMLKEKDVEPRTATLSFLNLATKEGLPGQIRRAFPPELAYATISASSSSNYVYTLGSSGARQTYYIIPPQRNDNQQVLSYATQNCGDYDASYFSYVLIWKQERPVARRHADGDSWCTLDRTIFSWGIAVPSNTSDDVIRMILNNANITSDKSVVQIDDDATKKTRECNRDGRWHTPARPLIVARVLTEVVGIFWGSKWKSVEPSRWAKLDECLNAPNNDGNELPTDINSCTRKRAQSHKARCETKKRMVC